MYRPSIRNYRKIEVVSAFFTRIFVISVAPLFSFLVISRSCTSGRGLGVTSAFNFLTRRLGEEGLAGASKAYQFSQPTRAFPHGWSRSPRGHVPDGADQGASTPNPCAGALIKDSILKQPVARPRGDLQLSRRLAAKSRKCCVADPEHHDFLFLILSLIHI